MPKKTNRRRMPRGEKDTAPKHPQKQTKPATARGKPIEGKKKKHPVPGVSEQAAANRLRAFELRSRRYTYEMIAADLKVSVKTAWEYVNETLATMKTATAEAVDNLRALELASLDEQERALIVLEEKLRPLALMEQPIHEVEVDEETGEVKSVDADRVSTALTAADKLAKISKQRVAIGERRSFLLGLDAPQKVEHGGVISLDEAEQRFQEALK